MNFYENLKQGTLNKISGVDVTSRSRLCVGAVYTPQVFAIVYYAVPLCRKRSTQHNKTASNEITFSELTTQLL